MQCLNRCTKSRGRVCKDSAASSPSHAMAPCNSSAADLRCLSFVFLLLLYHVLLPAVYRWINIPAVTDLKSPSHPWNYIRSLSYPEDYVVVKLDIDTPAVEIELMQQLLDDDTLNPLIDEFYFEHHVNVTAMW